MSLASQNKNAFNEAVLRKYAPRFRAIQAEKPSFDKQSAINLGTLLENVNDNLSSARGVQFLTEATQTTDVANGIKNQYFDIITAVWPNLLAEDLFSVQPLQSKIGQVFYMKYVYGDDKGTVKANDTIFSSGAPNGETMAGYEGKYYTSDIIQGEELAAQAEGGTQKVFEGVIDYTPIKPGTVVIEAEVGNATVIIKDKGDNKLYTFNPSTGAYTELANSGINYRSGAWNITFTTAPDAGSSILGNYEEDNEYAPAVTPSFKPQVESLTIQTRTRKLVGNYSFNAYYDLKMSQGIDLEESMLKAAAEQLKGEVDRELISTAYEQAGQSIAWFNSYDNKNAHVKKKDVYEDYVDCILSACSMIQQATKRVYGNWVVTGKKGADILAFLGAPMFEASGEHAVGAHYFGLLNGNIKVYFDPFMPQDAFLVGYKGSDFMDAGLIYAPYLLFFATNPNMLEDFISRRGFITSYGKKMVNNKMYVRGVILPGVGVTATTYENPTNAQVPQSSWPKF